MGIVILIWLTKLLAIVSLFIDKRFWTNVSELFILITFLFVLVYNYVFELLYNYLSN